MKFIDPKDVVFYEVAMSKDNSYLVTGNTKHFPAVRRVVTPKRDVGDSQLA
jgi:predicted nucleic acid-binding protein